MEKSSQRKELEKKIIEKAMKDLNYRKDLIDHPKQIIEQEIGVQLPESLQLHVMEEDAQTFYIVLPYQQNNKSEMELTDTELESVAGGDTIWSWVLACEAYSVGCKS